MATNNFSASVSLNTGQSNKSVRTLSDNVTNLSKALNELDASIKKSNGSFDSIAQSVNTSSDAMRQAADTTKQLAKSRETEAGAADKAASAEKKKADSYGQSTKATESAATAAGKASKEYSNATEGSRSLGTAQDDLAGKTRRAKDGTDQYSDSLASHRYLMYDVGATYRTISTALLAIPAATSAVAAAYEKDFAQVMRTTGLAGEEAQAFNRDLKQLATEIPTTFSELSNVARVGGQMGVADQALGSFTETVIRFVETADGVDIDKASTAFGRLENMFNVTPSGELADPRFFERIGSAISYTADNSVTTEQAIISMLDKTTASAKNAGLSIQETISMSSAMASSGLRPFLSSGFIIRFFGNFQKAAAQGGDAVEDLAGKLNMTADEFQNVVRNDPYQLLHRVVTQMKDMDSVSSQDFLSQLGINGVQDPKVLNALSENLHVLEGAMDDVNSAYGEASYLKEASEGIFGTTAAQIQMLANSFMNLGSTIGSTALPGFSHMLEAATTLVSGIDDLISKSTAAQVIVGGLFSLALVGGGIAAFRSTLAFVNASLVMFRDAAQKGAIAGGRFGGIARQMAEIALYHKGATEQQVTSMMKGRSTTAAFMTAMFGLKKEVQGVTVATQANTGAQAANTAAKSRAAGATSAQTAATVAAAGATDRHTGAMARSTAVATGFRSVGKGIAGALQSLLNPALLIPTAILGIGTAMLTAKSDTDQFRESVAETISSFNEFDGAYDSIISQFAEKEKGLLSLHNTWSTLNKDMTEIADMAGVTEEQLRTAFEGGSDGVRKLAEELESTHDQLVRTDGYGAQTDALYVFYKELEGITGELEELEDKQGNAERLGGSLEDSFGAAGDAAADAAGDVNSFEQSISDAMDTVFGFVNAEAALTSALDSMGQGLHESADMTTATTQGVSNIENYQRAVSAALEMMEQDLREGTFSTVQEAQQYYESFFLGLQDQLTGMGVDPTQAQIMTDMALDAMQMTIGAEGNELVADLDVDPTRAFETAMLSAEEIEAFVNGREINFTLDADGQPATDMTWEVVNWIADTMGIPAEAVLDAIDGTATANTEQVGMYLAEVVHNDYIAQLDADTGPAYSALHSFANWMVDTLGRLGEMLNGLLFSLTKDHSFLVANVTGGSIPQPRQTSTITPVQQFAQPSRPEMSGGSGRGEAPSIPKPDFGALNKGYNNAAKAANGAGRAAKKAGNDGKKAGDSGKKGADAAKQATDKAREAAEKAAQKARDWNKEWQDLQSWAGRVGEALQMAFDQKHAVQSARDEYYTVLNGINDRLDQQKQRVKELREETKRLTAERRVELNEASKFERMSQIAGRHGNSERAEDYRDQAKAMRERAREMSSTISANRAEQSTIKAGIGNLSGYSQAAIDNRQELRQLEQAALKVPEAYASIGASASTVANQTRIWTGRVQTHAREMGYTNTQVRNNTTATSNYIRELNRVPRNIPTVVNASHKGVPGVNRALNNVSQPRSSRISPYTSGVPGADRALNRASRGRRSRIGAITGGVGAANRAFNHAARNRTSTIRVRAVGGAGLGAASYLAGRNSGGLVPKFNLGGQIDGFNSGGLIPGRSPSDPREDNLLANVDNQGMIAVRSQEFIQPEPAVNHYGVDFMEDIRKMRLPKYYAGGSPGGASGGGSEIGVMDLSAKSINLLAKQLRQTTILEADGQQLARSVSRGQKENDQKRGVFRGV